MSLFYRGDRMRVELKNTPDTSKSVYEFVSALRKAGENDDAITRVITSFAALNSEQICHSLLELASDPDWAFLALKAAKQMNHQSVMRYAGGVIKNTGLLSDEVKRLSTELLGNISLSKVAVMAHDKGG